MTFTKIDMHCHFTDEYNFEKEETVRQGETERLEFIKILKIYE
jgi:hypothetical protein